MNNPTRIRLTLLCCFLFVTPSVAQEPAISPNLNNAIGNSLSYVWGMQFVPSEDIIVSDLGWFDQNGDGFANGPHAVGIFRVSDQELLSSASCSTTSDLDNGFRYESIEPLLLEIGETYLLVGFDPVGNGDQVLRDLDFQNVNSHPQINVEGTRDQNGIAGLAFPTGALDTTPSSWRMGANFKLLVSDQDFWSGNGPIGGWYYFNHGPNWEDATAPTEIDNARFLFADQAVSWSNNYGGNSSSRNLFVNNSDLVFQSTDAPTKTHSVTDNVTIDSSVVTLGDSAETPMNLDISGDLILDKANLSIQFGSQAQSQNVIALDCENQFEPDATVSLTDNSQLTTGHLDFKGNINVLEGSTLESQTATLGSDSCRTVAIIDGASSEWSSQTIEIGRGELEVQHGATVSTSNFYLGDFSPPNVSALIRVEGIGSTLNSDLFLLGQFTGGGSNRYVYVTDGGILSGTQCVVGFESGSVGFASCIVDVSGENSVFDCTTTNLGALSAGTLRATNGAMIHCTELNIGVHSTTQPIPSRVFIASDSILLVEDLHVGSLDFGYGKGELTIASGGTVIVSGDTTIVEDLPNLDFGRIILNGGDLEFGNLDLEALSRVVATSGTLSGKVQILGSIAASSIENQFQFPEDVNDSGITLKNLGLIEGEGTILRSLSNCGELEFGELQTMNITENVDNESGGEIRCLGGALTIGGTLYNQGRVDSVGQITVDEGIVNEGELEFGFGPSSLSADLSNGLGGQIKLMSSLLTLNGNLQHDSIGGSTIAVDDNSELVVLGTWTGDGSFTGTGNVVFAGGANPGLETSEVQFGGNVILSPATIVEFQIGGTQIGEFDRLNISGDFSINSQLSVTMHNGFQLLPEMEFEIANVDGQTFEHFEGLEQGALVGNFNGVNLYVIYNGGDGNDVVLTTTPVTIELSPETLVVTRGNLFSGGTAELIESDNSDVSIRRQNNDVRSRTEFEITFTSPTSIPSSLSFSLEGSVFARSEVTQTVRIYDFNLDAWEIVDTRSASRFSDRTDVANAYGDLSRFVEQSSNQIRMQIGFNSISPRQNFTSNTDQIVVTISL